MSIQVLCVVVMSVAHNKCVQPTAHALSICVHSLRSLCRTQMANTCTAADAGVMRKKGSVIGEGGLRGMSQ